MATLFKMPKFGLTMTEGTVENWLVEEGDEVKEGDLIVEISTEKITNSVEAPATGILRKKLAAEGETLPVQANIGVIAEPDEDITHLLEDGEEATAEEELQAESKAQQEEEIEKEAEVIISHLARKLIDKHKIKDIHKIERSGPQNSITKGDVEKYLKGLKKDQEQTFKEKEWTERRKVIARRMMESLESSAQTTLTMDIDVTELVKKYAQKKQELERQGLRLTYTAIFVKKVAEALEEHPALLTIIEDGKLQEFKSINIGVAVDDEEGLIVPVIKGVEKMDLQAVSKELTEIQKKIQEKKLSLADLQGGVMTVSNLGMLGIKYFTPILNSPESAILGLGRIQEKPLIVEGEMEIRSVLYASLTHDHRVFDGGEGARFLNTFARLLNS